MDKNLHIKPKSVGQIILHNITFKNIVKNN